MKTPQQQLGLQSLSRPFPVRLIVTSGNSGKPKLKIRVSPIAPRFHSLYHLAGDCLTFNAFLEFHI